MIPYLLDTNTCIELIRGRSERVLGHLRRREIGTVALSAITLAELHCGVARSSAPERNMHALLHFCAPLVVLPFEDRAAAAYGDLRATLERIGRPIGPLDMLIAAHALAVSAVVVTSNEREFRRVEGLAVENWAA